MNEHIHSHIANLDETHLNEIMQNMTNHALLTALLTDREIQEHELMELMQDHIQEIISR